jgi:signal transduction histidine kinase/ligand-binding sensor domain-containing protein
MRGRAPLISSVAIVVLSTIARSQAAIGDGNDRVEVRRFHHSVWPAVDSLPGYLPGVSGLIGQSADGYLWISASHAVYRFDGTRFSAFRPDEHFDANNHPPNDALTSVWGVDAHGRTWFSYVGGVVFTYERGRFTPLPRRDTAFALGPFDLVHARDGRVLATIDGHPSEWRDGRFVRADVAGMDTTTIHGMAASPQGGVVAAHFSGRLERVNGTTARPLFRFTSTDPTTYQVVESGSYVWSASDRDLVRVYGDSARAIFTGRHTGDIRAVAGDRDGGAWVATERALLHVDSAGAVVENIPSAELANASVYTLFVDAERTVWVATALGLESFRRTPFWNATLFHEGHPVSHDAVVWDAAGRLWAATSTVRSYTVSVAPAPDSGEIVRLRDRFPSLRTGLIVTVAPGRAGVWVATPDTLYHWNGGVPARYAFNGSGGPVSILETRSGEVWIATVRGLAELRAGRIVPRTWNMAVRSRVPIRWSGNSLFEGADGTLWAGAGNTLLRIKGDSVSRWDRRSGLRDVPVTAFAEDTTGTVWIAAGSGVVLRLRNGRLDEAIPSGALGERVLAMKVDRAGFLWLAGGSHLNRVALTSLNATADGGVAAAPLQTFSALDGVPSGSLANGRFSIRESTDGTLWFGRDQGFVVFDPRALPAVQPPAALIDEVHVGSRSAAAGTEPITAASNDARIQVRYTVANLGRPESIRFRYKLEGLDPQWGAAGTERVVNYSGLAPGTYRFRVQAASGLSDWGPIAEQILTKLPHWYETTAAYAVAGLALVLVGAGGAGWRVRTKHRLAEIRYRSMMQERNRVAREMHDTLLQGFTGITLQLDHVRRRIASAPDAAEATLGRLLEQADSTLASARRAVWEMRAPELESAGLAVALEAALRRIVVEDVELKYATLGRIRPLEPALEAAVFHIGLEATANALKHAAPSVLTVELRFEPAAIAITVTDDGRGFDPMESIDDGRVHFGVAGIRERCARFGGALHVKSARGEGTTIFARLPSPM